MHRQALELDLRGKREYTEAVLSAMGGISNSHFSELKALLRLSDEALELADRHALSSINFAMFLGFLWNIMLKLYDKSLISI